MTVIAPIRALKTGGSAVVKGYADNLPTPMLKHIMELGFAPNKPVHVIQKMGGSSIVSIENGPRFALDANASKNVLVEAEQDFFDLSLSQAKKTRLSLTEKLKKLFNK